ncbi:MAG: N-acetylmuramoyl-L-alanine amidase [Lachnospiraceae bacterium]|nr:N-acetylmuramoyl-L-alanine amidase [Lachnospiraceae bacterium]
MKKLMGILLSLAMLISCTACGLTERLQSLKSSEDASSSYAGRYYLVSSNDHGKTTVYETPADYLRLDEEGEARLSALEKSIKGSWEAEGAALTLELDGERAEGRIEDGVISIHLLDRDMVFVAGKAEAAARAASLAEEIKTAKQESPAAESSPEETLPETSPSPENTQAAQTEEPATSEEAASETPAETAEEPSSEESAAEEPSEAETTEEPATEEPTTEEPTTEEPTTEPPEEFAFEKRGSGYYLTGPGTYSGKDIKIPEEYDGLPVIGIGEEAFSGATIYSLSVPASVKEIGEAAFADAVIHEDVILKQVEKVDDKAFSGTRIYGELVFQDALETVGERAFADMEADGILLPVTVNAIGAGAFSGTKADKLEYGGSRAAWNSLAAGTDWETSIGSGKLSCAENGNGIVICLDPSHQATADTSQEPIGPGASATKNKMATGATGTYYNTKEYALVLEIALQLRDELEGRGYTVIMTRESNNVNISNKERAEIANQNNADAFIRIFCDYSNDNSYKGVAALCPSNGNPYLSKDLVNRSLSLAQTLLNRLASATGANSRGIDRRGDMTAINWSKVPVCVMNLGYMSNKSDEGSLISANYQRKIVVGLANGIDDYFGNTIYP